jgi:hypothetical protein
MEAGVRARRDLILLAAFTLLLHAPFLTQPVQGDEVTYLDIAGHVLTQPLTPLNFQYVFMGRLVDATGHPHPPLNAYLLAVARILHGHFSVAFFHIFYLLFALGISFGAYALAGRFTSQPLWGALLVASSPLVQVNTNTLAGPEAPALAFLLIGAAAFFARRFWIAAIALALSGLTELQALALPPILLLEYLLRRERPSRAAWLALAAPYLGVGAWQALQWGLTHRLPGAVVLSYGQSPAFSRLGMKAASALALLQHLGVLVIVVPLARRRLWCLVPGLLASFMVHDYPWWERALLAVFVALGVNALLWLWESRRNSPLLASWCLFYFAFAATVFFAGASRYLLVLVAPMALLFVLQFNRQPGRLALALGVNLVLGLNLSFAAYEFARVYPEVQPPPGRPFLVNGDWGFRYYLLDRGGQALYENSVPTAGEWIVSSELSLGGSYDSLAEEAAVPLRTVDLRVRTPLRLIDRYAHSGFSSASSGLLPFSFSLRPLDRITYSRTSSFLDVPGPWTPTQFSGRLVYLAVPGAPIHIPLDSQGTLRFALFGRGRGTAAFRISRPSGENLMQQTVAVEGDLWEPRTLSLVGLKEALLSIDSPPELRAGWGELVCDSDQPPATAIPTRPVAEPGLSYLNLGDIRSKAQLRAGWYGIEDGGWRWMSKRAEAVLRVPADVAPGFEIQLFFPPGFMQRAGGPITLSVLLDGHPLARETYREPGGYRLAHTVTRELLTRPTTLVTLQLDRTVPPGESDRRELGTVVSRLGFVAIGR